MGDESRDWIKIGIAVLAIVVSVIMATGKVLTDLRETTARHDQDHIGFRRDINELREDCKTCRK